MHDDDTGTYSFTQGGQAVASLLLLSSALHDWVQHPPLPSLHATSIASFSTWVDPAR